MKIFYRSYDFFRVHHSYIINRQYIQRYVRGEEGRYYHEQ
jgi:DNA-binding LytR/AlgR family response regulator